MEIIDDLVIINRPSEALFHRVSPLVNCVASYLLVWKCINIDIPILLFQMYVELSKPGSLSLDTKVIFEWAICDAML